jgi:hypothetical protein
MKLSEENVSGGYGKDAFEKPRNRHLKARPPVGGQIQPPTPGAHVAGPKALAPAAVILRL